MDYKYYLTQHINVIAVNDSKQAIFPWKEFQNRSITDDEIAKQVSDHRARGLAVICGAVSGGLEVIDFDLKYATWDIYKEVVEKVPYTIYKKMHIVKTKSHGYHWYYKCETIEGNQKLASRLPTMEETKNNPHIKGYTIIETRGEGGYVVAPPSSGYQIEQEGINIINIEERELLFEVLRSFNEIVEETVLEAQNRPTSKEYAHSPFEDFNKRGDLRAVLQAHGWSFVKSGSGRDFYRRPGGESDYSGSFNYELGLFSVFSTNTPFIVQKGYKPYAVYAILECNGDFKLAAKRLAEAGYGERKEVIASAEIDDINVFWYRNARGRIEINRFRFVVFLSEVGGFRLYFYDKGSTIYRLVRIYDGFVEEASTEQIKKFIKDHINLYGGDDAAELLEIVYKGSGVYFSDQFFEFLERADIDFLKDTKDVGYFPFLNGVVEVSRTDIRLRSYGELGRYVWRSQVLDHHIYINQEGIDPESIEFFRFLRNVSGGEIERTMYAVSLIGYLLHQYKDPARPYAIILAEETDNEEKGGGTGKGIFVKAISHMVKTVRVDGKNFKLDKNFAFQRVDLDTRVVAIEDTRKRVDFEGFYSLITEGISVEKKNKDELYIPYKDSPKIMFTTNYSISQSGVHSRRRQKIFEFAPYYGLNRTPQDEFGHKFFDDWDKDEWNRFYNFFAFCVQDYLSNGVQEYGMTASMIRKNLKNQFGDEFAEYFEEISCNDQWVGIDPLHQEFLSMYGLDKKDYSRKKFTSALKYGSEIFGLNLEVKKHVLERGKVALRIGKFAGQMRDKMEICGTEKEKCGTDFADF